jgi:hypothetical protein
MNFLTTFFVEKREFLSIFFWSKIENFFYTFLRVSLRKINIFRKAKLHPTELNKVYGLWSMVYDMNEKYLPLKSANILKSTIQKDCYIRI